MPLCAPGHAPLLLQAYFLMLSVLTTELAELVQLELIGTVLPVLLDVVVLTATLAATQDHLGRWHLFHPACLLDHLGYYPGADGQSALANGEAHARFHRDRLDHLDAHGHIVAGHNHLGTLGQRDRAGNISGAEVELRPIAVEERLMATALVLGEDVEDRKSVV